MTVLAALLAVLASLDSFADDLGEGYVEMVSGAPAGIGVLASATALVLEPGIEMRGFMGEGPADAAAEVCDRAFGFGSLALSTAVWAAGGLSGDQTLERDGLLCTEALVLSLGVTGLLKVATGRERPDLSDRLSFPSFHSASSAAVAAVAWREHGPGAGIPLAAVSAFTALSRVHRGDHHLSDVVAGLAAGAAAGLAITSRDGDGEDSAVFGLEFSGDGLMPVVR